MFIFIKSKESLHGLPPNATKQKQYQRKERTCSTPRPIEGILKTLYQTNIENISQDRLQHISLSCYRCIAHFDVRYGVCQYDPLLDI